jgi:hypothetical protein
LLFFDLWQHKAQMVSLKAFSIMLKLREYILFLGLNFSPYLMFTPLVLSQFSTKQICSHEAKPEQVSIMRLVSKNWIAAQKNYIQPTNHILEICFSFRFARMNSPRGKRASCTCHFVAAISRFVAWMLRWSHAGGIPRGISDWKTGDESIMAHKIYSLFFIACFILYLKSLGVIFYILQRII